MNKPIVGCEWGRVIDAMGGPTFIFESSEEPGRPTLNSLQLWRHRNHVPANWLPWLLLQAHRYGVDVLLYIKPIDKLRVAESLVERDPKVIRELTKAARKHARLASNRSKGLQRVMEDMPEPDPVNLAELQEELYLRTLDACRARMKILLDTDRAHEMRSLLSQYGAERLTEVNRDYLMNFLGQLESLTEKKE